VWGGGETRRLCRGGGRGGGGRGDGVAAALCGAGGGAPREFRGVRPAVAGHLNLSFKTV